MEDASSDKERIEAKVKDFNERYEDENSSHIIALSESDNADGRFVDDN